MVKSKPYCKPCLLLVDLGQSLGLGTYCLSKAFCSHILSHYGSFNYLSVVVWASPYRMYGKSQLPASSTPIYFEGRISVEEMGINRKEHLAVDTLMI